MRFDFDTARYDADGDLIGITIVGVRKLVDEHRDVQVRCAQ